MKNRLKLVVKLYTKLLKKINFQPFFKKNASCFVICCINSAWLFVVQQIIRKPSGSPTADDVKLGAVLSILSGLLLNILLRNIKRSWIVTVTIHPLPNQFRMDKL